MLPLNLANYVAYYNVVPCISPCPSAGDEEAGNIAMKSASRTTGVLGAGLGGFFLAGPAGAVAGGVAGGLAMDATTTMFDSAVHREYRPNGQVAAVAGIRKKLENGENIAGDVFDVVATTAFDGLSGITAAKVAIDSGLVSNSYKATSSASPPPVSAGAPTAPQTSPNPNPSPSPNFVPNPMPSSNPLSSSGTSISASINNPGASAASAAASAAAAAAAAAHSSVWLQVGGLGTAAGQQLGDFARSAGSALDSALTTADKVRSVVRVTTEMQQAAVGVVAVWQTVLRRRQQQQEQQHPPQQSQSDSSYATDSCNSTSVSGEVD